MEIDVVAESAGGGELLLGEVKWTGHLDAARWVAELRGKASRFPLARGRKLRLALWAPDGPRRQTGDVGRFGAREVLAALR
jgi:hypothetical protein